MVQCRTHVRCQPDCESGLPWYAACNGTLSECPTNISDPEAHVSSPTWDSDANSSYITIPRSPNVHLQCPCPYGHSTRHRNAIPMLCRCCGEPGHFARECPKAYDVRYMSSDEREDWIERLLSRSDVV